MRNTYNMQCELRNFLESHNTMSIYLTHTDWSSKITKTNNIALVFKKQEFECQMWEYKINT